MFTVSLVTYRHSLADIRNLVESVLNSACFRLYIVDHSPDTELGRELAVLAENKICYISQANKGYGAGHNTAIREAMREGVAFHIVVNPDIAFAEGTMERIVAYMEKNPETGLLMPKTVSPKGNLLYNCKLVPSPLDLIYKRFAPSFMKKKRMHRFMMKDFDYGKILDVPYLCGCFMAFNCEVLKMTGAFDERFFMYPEDIDITRRIFGAGYRTVYYPEEKVTHVHTRSSYRSIYMLWIHIVNMIRYFNKWGWIFDRERVAINAKILEMNRDKKLPEA